MGVISSFLQDLINKRRAFFTMKVYLAAIAACHVGFGGLSASPDLPLHEGRTPAPSSLQTPGSPVGPGSGSGGAESKADLISEQI